MTALDRLAAAAGVAAVLAFAVADAFAAMDRALSNCRVDSPDFIPDWVDDGSAQW